MSTRTIIEINHDELIHLVRDQERWTSLLTGLKCGEFANGHPVESPDGCVGIRILGQRHHSEPEWKRAMKRIGWTCGEGDCGRIHDEPGADGSYAVPVYVADERAPGAGGPDVLDAAFWRWLYNSCPEEVSAPLRKLWFDSGEFRAARFGGNAV